MTKILSKNKKFKIRFFAEINPKKMKLVHHDLNIATDNFIESRLKN